MITMIRPLIVLMITCLALLAGRASADPSVSWSVGLAVPGEQVYLYVLDEVSQGVGMVAPTRLRVQNAGYEIRPIQTVLENSTSGMPRRLGILSVRITPDGPGEVKIEPFELEFNDGTKKQITPPSLKVYSTSKIVWYDEPFRYGVLAQPDALEGYVHQQQNVFYKLFLPDGAGILGQYPPQLESVGVRCSEVQLWPGLLLRDGLGGGVGRAHSGGRAWNTYDYTALLTPMQEGSQQVGGKCTLFAGSAMKLPMPAVTLKSLPLPPAGKPQGFDNAVGSFKLSSRTQASELSLNEAIEVDIIVSGRGDLEHLPVPQPEEAANWKLSGKPSRNLTRNADGRVTRVTFTQIMRPTAEVDGIPSFRLPYFNPADEEYHTAFSRPIPLKWKLTEATAGLQGADFSAPEPLPAGEVPVAEMRDIYGSFLGEEEAHVRVLPRWLWYLLYLPALGLGAYLLARPLCARFRAGAATRRRERTLRELAAVQQGVDFLKGLGSLIEANIPPDRRDAALQAILARRDAEAFRPAAQVDLPAEERTGMLQSVRRALSHTVLLMLCVLLPAAWSAEPTPAEKAPSPAPSSASAAYEAGQFSQAKALLQDKTDPASLFNTGNCCYRLNEPGQAALFYARALLADPSLAEARANLEFIQRKEGAVLAPEESTAERLFTRLSPSLLWILTVSFTAVLAFCIVLLIALRGRRKAWVHAVAALSLGLSLLCALNWLYYFTREVPDFRLLPPADTAYVTTATKGRSAADATAAEIIDLPASTPLRRLSVRASWSYIQTATGIRAWVPTSDVTPLLPNAQAPSMPITISFR